MKLCPQGHENPDDALRCSVCYQRIGAESAVLMFVGAPTGPLAVKAGEELEVSLQLLMAGPDEAACSVSVTGNGATWAHVAPRSLAVRADHPTAVSVTVAVPASATAGTYSITVTADVEGGMGQTASAAVVFAVAAAPQVASTAPQPVLTTAPAAPRAQPKPSQVPLQHGPTAPDSRARPRSRAVIAAVVAAFAVVLVGGIALWLLNSGPSLDIEAVDSVGNSVDVADAGDKIFLTGVLNPPREGVPFQVQAARNGGEYEDFPAKFRTDSEGSLCPGGVLTKKCLVITEVEGKTCWKLVSLDASLVLESSVDCVTYR